MTPHFCLLLCWLTLPLQGLQIDDPEEVEYINLNLTASVGGSVTLDCGSSMPSIFIWGFTKPGTENSVALASCYRQGLMLLAQSSSLGNIQVPENSSALVIEELQTEAEGRTPVRLCTTPTMGASVTYFSHKLELEDD